MPSYNVQMTKHATLYIPIYQYRFLHIGETAFAAIVTAVLIDDQLINIT